MAYVDGALPGDDMRRIEAMVQADPELRARLLPFELTRARLPGLITGALASPIPDRLVETILNAPIGSTAKAGYASRPPQPSLFSRLASALLPEMPAFAGAFALAASVALIAGGGFMAARLVPGTGIAQPEAASDQEAIASGPLREALETVASGSRFERGLLQVTPVLTVRDHDGNFCRQYVLQRAGAEPFAGFACRTGAGRWSIAFHAPSSAGAGHAASVTAGDEFAYQPASGEGASAIDRFIDKASNGDVVTGRDEADLISKGWPRS